jgi:alkanesulfonate monooxygenase SsuD/methylene tetrahydromethanopterin reductase-like flavin-dependent oxidoreductase (luciferase family)
VSASLNLLSFLAACTTKMRLGTAVVVLPWHNPVLLAEQIATLDVLSGGRVDFGVGKGYRPNEFDGFCVPQGEATERFEEVVEVVRKAWTSEGRFSHEGKHWKFNNIVVEPAPIQRPHPPFWMGAGSAESIRHAAQEGYNLLLDQVGNIELTVERVRVYRETIQAMGQHYSPYRVGVTRGLYITKTPEERARALKMRVEGLKTIGSISKPWKGMAIPSYDEQNIAADDAALIGTPDEIIERLERLRSGGVEYVLIVNSFGTVEALETFAEEIIPHFQKQAAASAQPVAA